MMSSQTPPEMMDEQPDGSEEQNGLFEAARKVLLASIGAMALAQEEIEDFVHRLIERGEIAEQDGRKLMREVMEKRRKEVRTARSDVDKRVDQVIPQAALPTKADIETLSAKIAELSKKLDDLNKSQK